jgi:hypothetical protein
MQHDADVAYAPPSARVDPVDDEGGPVDRALRLAACEEYGRRVGRASTACALAFAPVALAIAVASYYAMSEVQLDRLGFHFPVVTGLAACGAPAVMVRYIPAFLARQFVRLRRNAWIRALARSHGVPESALRFTIGVA